MSALVMSAANIARGLVRRFDPKAIHHRSDLSALERIAEVSLPSGLVGVAYLSGPLAAVMPGTPYIVAEAVDQIPATMNEMIAQWPKYVAQGIMGKALNVKGQAPSLILTTSPRFGVPPGSDDYMIFGGVLPVRAVDSRFGGTFYEPFETTWISYIDKLRGIAGFHLCQRAEVNLITQLARNAGTKVNAVSIGLERNFNSTPFVAAAYLF